MYACFIYIYIEREREIDIYIYIYIAEVVIVLGPNQARRERAKVGPQSAPAHVCLGGGDDTVANPHRAQISRFVFFELRFLNSSCSSLSSY